MRMTPRELTAFLLVAIVLLACATLIRAAPPQAPRPPQAPYTPGPPQTCPCAGTADCACDLAGGRCACRACLTEPVRPTWHEQEAKWRAEGWRRDSAGNWYRPLTAAELRRWQPPVTVPALPMPAFGPPLFFGGGFGGGGGGGC